MKTLDDLFREELEMLNKLTAYPTPADLLFSKVKATKPKEEEPKPKEAK